MTLGEILLWNKIKQNQMMNYDFDRQRPIDEFIVDFYCKDLMLAIEIDGYSHFNEDAYYKDLIRQKRLEQLGVTVLRFFDADVKKDMNNVLRAIQITIEEMEEIATKNEYPTKPQRPTPSPSKEGN